MFEQKALSRVEINALFNLTAQGLSGALQLACVPALVTKLGVEAYGLIGLFASIEAVLIVADMTLSTAASREIAARYEAPDKTILRAVFSAYERCFVLFGAWLGAVLLLASPQFAARLQTDSLPRGVILPAVCLVALSTAFRGPASFYRTVIQSTQRQGLAASITAIAAVLRYGGSIVIVSWVIPDIRALAAWQCVSAVFEGVVSRCVASRLMPGRLERPAWHVLRAARPYMARMALLALTSLALNHSDRVMLAMRCSLDEVGRYNIAKTLSTGLLMAIAPLFTALFPRLSELAARDRADMMYKEIDAAAVISSAAAGLIASVLLLFAPELMRNFGYDWPISLTTTLLLLLLGASFNAVGGVPYALQLATGRNDQPLLVNLVGVPVCMAVAWALTPLYGATGAAFAFSSFSIAAMLIGAFMSFHAVGRSFPITIWWLLSRAILPGCATVIAIVVVYLAAAGEHLYVRVGGAVFAGVATALFSWRALLSARWSHA